jgi:hypothetical protein
MRWQNSLFLACLLLLSLGLLGLMHYLGDPGWLTKNLPATSGAAGILWQVQTTFLSVGFAGLAIAAQLFAEAPLAVGASRGKVLAHVRANWFVGVGLVTNAVVAVETIWLPSAIGLLIVSAGWSVATVILLIVATVKLTQLFSHPSILDEVVRVSLTEALLDRLRDASSKYADVTKELADVVQSGWNAGSPRGAAITLRVPAPEIGRVIKAIRVKAVRQAKELMSIRATDEGVTTGGVPAEYVPTQLTLDLEPGDRTTFGQTAFRIITSQPLDEPTSRKVVRLLQSSIEFEPAGSVTPYEESDREIASLKDAIGINFRSGAFATAERALELLGQVVRGVWTVDPEQLSGSRRSSYTRRDWVFRSVGEVEEDALLSPRVAGILVSAAMNRALEAPRIGASEYVDECLRSFTRMWLNVLANGGREFDAIPSRIVTCIQNLAAYSYSVAENREDLQSRAVWAMVDLVKLALDSKRLDFATLAAEELSALFEFDSDGTGRTQVRGGQLVLSGWLDFLAATHDEREPADPRLHALVTPGGSWSDIIAARATIERGSTPFSRWNWWEVKTSASSRAQRLQLSHYIDGAEVAALSVAYGLLPPVTDQDMAFDYQRFVKILLEPNRMLTENEHSLRARLDAEVAKWDAAEDGRLAHEPLSDNRIEEMRIALRDALGERPRLADQITVDEVVPSGHVDGHPILGMNFRIPRHYFVDKVFGHTYADPKELGRIIAQGFSDGEEQKVVNELRKLHPDFRKPLASSIRHAIYEIGNDAEHFVLLTPFGGLEELDEWYSVEFRDVLQRVTHIETAALDHEAVLFDRRSTLCSSREPEDKPGLVPVDGTFLALGVFEDVPDENEPQVRVETGEYFVVWPGGAPNVVFFAVDLAKTADIPSGDVPPEGQ